MQWIPRLYSDQAACATLHSKAVAVAFVGRARSITLRSTRKMTLKAHFYSSLASKVEEGDWVWW